MKKNLYVCVCLLVNGVWENCFSSPPPVWVFLFPSSDLVRILTSSDTSRYLRVLIKLSERYHCDLILRFGQISGAYFIDTIFFLGQIC